MRAGECLGRTSVDQQAVFHPLLKLHRLQQVRSRPRLAGSCVVEGGSRDKR